MGRQTLGKHILVEFYGCPSEVLNDVVHIEKSMTSAAKEAQATIINSTFHHFSPFGVSGVVVIQESHLAIHTWPEYGYVALDIFTCGDTVDHWQAYRKLKITLQAEHGSAMELLRGQMSLLQKQDFSVPTRDQVEEDRQQKYSRNIWFTEKDANTGISLRHTGDVLFRQKSPFQKVEIYNTIAYGKMLTIDGFIMCTEKDEYVYHEMISHVAMLTHPNPKNVLVIGGGDGGTIREIVKHQELEKVTMVEIDEMVVDACKQHLPTMSSAFGHPKVDLQIADGVKYVMEAEDESLDIIMVDSTDPGGPSEGLFTEKFYRNAHRALRKNGILIAQSESPRFNQKVFQEIYQCYRRIFGSDKVHCYLAFISTYPSGMWSFSFCAKGDIHPLQSLDMVRYQNLVENYPLSYYNKDVHHAAFALPNFVQQLLQ